MDYHSIYREHAAEYDALVGAEDCDGNLLPALLGIAPLQGRRVVEVGAGTGRVTRLLLAAGAHVIATERIGAMLAQARQRLDVPRPPEQRPEQRQQPGRLSLVLAEAERLPIAAQVADVALAGWVLGHLRRWQPDGWRASVDRALAEMGRVLRPGGALILIETLGTGSEQPAAPSAELGEYHAWLEQQHGLARLSIRTDYQFDSIEDAARQTGFFFGAAFAERVRSEGWSRVPECTGIWWARQPGPP